MTLLLGASMYLGPGIGGEPPFPVILIPVLYGVRGFQIIKGDVAATKRITWLHVVGGIAAVVQMLTGNVLVMALNAVKVCIHLFGATTAVLATRSVSRARG